jgi:hypothetical protein
MKKIGAVSLGVALGATTLGTAGAVAHANSSPTGQSCTTEYFFNGQGIEIVGHRCAKASVNYTAANSSWWDITSYDILYTVTSGMTYGPHNNEDPASISSGFAGGTQSWLSPDSGATGSWINRNYPDSFSYKGQTVFHITAVPDIPNTPDPHLGIATATF